MTKMKNYLLFGLYTVLLGAVTGAIVWAFLKVMNIGIEYLWVAAPSKVSFPLYTVAVCLIGSLLIGLYKKKFGDYPEELNTVMAQVKKNNRYPYHNILAVLGAALFPLLLGASIGPEAGLTGVIAGLCTWVGDKLKKFSSELEDLTKIGVSATLGTIFRSPMFGFIEPLEGEEPSSLPKSQKIVLYLLAIVSSFGCFIGLNKLTGGSTGFADISFGGIEPLQSDRRACRPAAPAEPLRHLLRPHAGLCSARAGLLRFLGAGRSRIQRHQCLARGFRPDARKRPDAPATLATAP